MNEPVGYDKDGNEVALEDILQSPQEVMKEVENRLQQESIRKHLSQLSEQERDVLCLRYGIKDGIRETQRKIAEKLHISRSYVSRIEKRALMRIIEEMKKEEQERMCKVSSDLEENLPVQKK